MCIVSIIKRTKCKSAEPITFSEYLASIYQNNLIGHISFLRNALNDLIGRVPDVGNASNKIILLNPEVGNVSNKVILSNPEVGNESDKFIIPNPYPGNGSNKLIEHYNHFFNLSSIIFTTLF